MLTRAFQEDPLQCYALPDPEIRASLSPAWWSTFLRLGQMCGDVSITSGPVDGAVISQPPGADVTPEVFARAGFQDLVGQVGMESWTRFGEVTDFLGELAEREAPPDHWFVMAIGVDPERQGQGVGTVLMREVIERSRTAGAACYLSTALERNVRFYEQLGFRLMTDVVEPKSGLRFWTFLRDPA